MSTFNGAPLVASTASGMTNTSRIYVYTGSETGYVNGNWYYYDSSSSSWKTGGVYNEQPIQTDKDLVIEDAPADAKATGEAVDKKIGKDRRPFRYIFVSDTHYSNGKWYSVEDDERMRKLTKDLNYELSSSNVDAIFHLGDFSLDYWGSTGSLTYGKSNTECYLKRYFPTVKTTKIYAGPGNHECGYTNDQWKKMTGMDRQFTVIDRENNVAVIFLDTYKDSTQNPENYNSDGVYTNVDTTYLQSQVTLCQGMLIVLCAHYFSYGAESSEFKRIVRENDNILCLLQGHTHRSRVIDLGADYGNKKLLETGHYSYANPGITDPRNTMWGFRDLELTASGIRSNYIVPTYTATINGSTASADYHTQDSAIITTDYVAYTEGNYEYDDVEDRSYFSAYDELYSLSDSISLPSGADLDDIITPGIYTSQSGTYSSTMLHLPPQFDKTYGGFKLIVEKGYTANSSSNNDTANFVFQTFQSQAAQFGRIHRGYNVGTKKWMDWIGIENTILSYDEDDPFYNLTLHDIADPFYKLSNQPMTISFPYKSIRGGVWTVFAGVSVGGTITDCLELLVTEPYTSSGSINVFETRSQTGTTIGYTISGNSITFTSTGSNIRLYWRKKYI